LSDFKNGVTQKNFEEISKYFKVNNSLNKTSKSENSDEFIILTDNIAVSQKENNTIYTFQVLKETSEDEFYNLILTVNESEDIIKSEIYEYHPSIPYNSSSPSKFVGSVRIYQDNNLDISGLIHLKSEDRCIVDSVGYWECSFGYNHEPGSCNGAWFTYNVRHIYGPCPTEPELVDIEDGGNSNGPFDPPTGGGGNDNDDDTNDDSTDTSPINEPINYAEEIITCINGTNVIGGSNNQLTQHQIDWLNDATLREIRPLYEYLNENSCSEDAQNTVLIELELKDDIYFLLEVVDCNQILNWQSLVQHNAPQSVIDKLEGFDENTIGDVDIQEIEDASGTVINLDYYPVTVTTLPNNPTTGNQFTADEFLNHIRTNMNDFVDTTITSFEPSTITGYDEEALWSSNNPLTSIIHLDISGGPGDGSVICTSYENTNWIFTTLEVPYNLFLQGYDGEHPVSGNRQFGYTLNSNGSYTFFTRGVDRMTAWFDSAIAESFMDNPFTGAGNLWNSFKEGIYNFTIDHGGTANPVQDSDNSINRPDWDKVKDVLQGNRPISDLGC